MNNNEKNNNTIANQDENTRSLNISIANSYHNGVIETNLFVLKALITINGGAIISILTFIGNQSFKYNSSKIMDAIVFFIISLSLAIIAGGILSYMYYNMKSKYEYYNDKDKAVLKSNNAKNADIIFISLIIVSLLMFIVASIKTTFSISLNQKNKEEQKIITNYSNTLINIFDDNYKISSKTTTKLKLDNLKDRPLSGSKIEASE